MKIEYTDPYLQVEQLKQFNGFQILFKKKLIRNREY